MKKQTQEINKFERNFFYISSAIISLTIVGITTGLNFCPSRQNQPQEIVSSVSGENIRSNTNHRLEVNSELISVQDKIIDIASKNNFCIETALSIAECESQFGKYTHNFEGSSAKGIYQFTDKTWEDYCDGDVLNDEDNIKCFIKLYNKHPNWWACQK
jgi:hypothetical protein